MSLRRTGAIAAVVALSTAAAARGQVVDVQGGSSTLFDATGGSVGVRTAKTSTTIGIGTLQGKPTTGFLFQSLLGPLRLKVGDTFLDFQLPTDIFSGARYVPVRGAGTEVTLGHSRFQVFGGATSQGSGSPFFQGATWGQPAVLFFADIPNGDRWRFTSRAAVTDRLTSIQGVEWRKKDALSLAASGGVGAGRPYAATSITLEQSWLSARAGYTARAADFRRIDIETPTAAEVQRENGSLTIRPSPALSVSIGRQNLADAAFGPDAIQRVSVNQAGAAVTVRGVRTNAAVFSARRDGLRSVGISTSANRQVRSGLDAGVDYFRDESGGLVSQSVGGRIQEAVHPRLSLLQVASYDGHNTSINAGGQFLSNAATVNIGYQTTYAPFRMPSPFVRTIAIDVRVQLFGLDVQAGTYVTPDGRVRYTVRGRRFLSHRREAPSATSFDMGSYLVRGVVTDEDGQAVEGVVLQIDRETAISGRDGRFFVRARHSRAATVRVRTEEPAMPGSVAVVSAPERAYFAEDEEARDIRIVVHVSRGRY